MCKEIITTYSSNSGSTKTTATLYGNTPYGDYLRLKERYIKEETDTLLEGFKSIGIHFIPKSNKHVKRFQQVLFNTTFLRNMLNKCGSLTCVYCGKPDLIIFKCNEKKKLNKMATADHFNPKANGGGAYNVDNLVVSCYKCNNKKGQKLWGVETLKYISFYGDETILKEKLKYKLK